MRRTSTTLTGTAAAVVIVLAMLGNGRGWDADPAGPPPSPTASQPAPPPPSASPSSSPSPSPPPLPSPSPVSPSPVPPPSAAAPSSAALPPGVRARIPAASTQVVLVSGAGPDSSDSTLTLWTRTAEGSWQQQLGWPAHNGRDGWSERHLLGDLRSPVGVYGLSDAGGRRPDPGTRLPYHWDAEFTAEGTGFEGEPLAGSFDYVIAIDYNRVPGSSPLDSRRPLGAARGGGIWLHVDHGGPTHGCVTLTEDRMVALLRALDPAAHPVIVMGPAPD